MNSDQSRDWWSTAPSAPDPELLSSSQWTIPAEAVAIHSLELIASSAELGAL